MFWWVAHCHYLIMRKNALTGIVWRQYLLEMITSVIIHLELFLACCLPLVMHWEISIGHLRVTWKPCHRWWHFFIDFWRIYGLDDHDLTSSFSVVCIATRKNQHLVFVPELGGMRRWRALIVLLLCHDNAACLERSWGLSHLYVGVYCLVGHIGRLTSWCNINLVFEIIDFWCSHSLPQSDIWCILLRDKIAPNDVSQIIHIVVRLLGKWDLLGHWLAGRRASILCELSLVQDAIIRFNGALVRQGWHFNCVIFVIIMLLLVRLNACKLACDLFFSIAHFVSLRLSLTALRRCRCEVGTQRRISRGLWVSFYQKNLITACLKDNRYLALGKTSWRCLESYLGTTRGWSTLDSGDFFTSTLGKIRPAAFY